MNDKSLSEIFATDGARIAFTSALVVLTLFLIAQTMVLAGSFGRSGIPATDTITVSGDGQATLPPDVAKVTFTVQNTEATVVEAQAATTKQANAALAFVEEQGIADKDVRTLSYNIYPQYSYPSPCRGDVCPAYDNVPKIVGYQVSETVQVTVRDLTSVGAFLGGLGKLSVQNVSGPEFSLDDTTAGYDAARADAIAKAKEQATELARQLGVRLGKIVNFSESSGNRLYPMAYGMGGSAMDAKESAVPNIPAGENTYTSSVSITYEIR